MSKKKPVRLVSPKGRHVTTTDPAEVTTLLGRGFKLAPDPAPKPAPAKKSDDK